jgi:hypothetical protein
MKEIIEIIAVVGLFIFFFYFLYRIYLKSSKKEEKKEEKKSAPTASEKKEDIPEILKEVTMGNYMHDISKKVVVEQSVKKEENKIIDQFDIEKAFDIIDSQDLEDVEIEEIEDDIVSEIEVDMEKGIITNANGESITFKKLPPFMLEILEQGGLIEYLKNKK